MSLQHFRTICDLIVATTVTLAIELVISWNKITGANDLDSAAQLIPPVITGAFLAHSLCAWVGGSDGDSDDSNSYYDPRATISSRSGPPERGRRPARRRRSSYRRRCRRSRRASHISPDFLDAYPEMFDFSDLSLPTPPVSLSGYADPYVSGYYDMASDYYGMHRGEEMPPVMSGLRHVPPERPPAAAGGAASSHGGSRGASVIGEEGFIRL